MHNYHDLLRTVMQQGQDQYNARTGKLCRAIVGCQLQYDLANGFPAITTKKLAFNNMRGELLGFFRGYTNAADFRALGCNVWDQNANETPGWLANPVRKGVDDLGRIYGAQWTDWRERRIVAEPAERERLLQQGYWPRMSEEQIDEHGKRTEYLMERAINQLEAALAKLLADPTDRRIIVSGWNVGELDLMALPPCHMDYRFVAFDGATRDAPKTLHVVMTIRSWDLFLGAPFNIASTALFLAIMARLAGMTPGTATIQATNAHIYEDHFEQVNEQLGRDHLPSPKLWLSENLQPATPADVPGIFTRIVLDDIKLENYRSHAALKAPMAA